MLIAFMLFLFHINCHKALSYYINQELLGFTYLPRYTELPFRRRTFTPMGEGGSGRQASTTEYT